jgi:hypothetical protein
MSIDHTKVESLLNIVRECAGHTGKLASISAAAMTELMSLNEDIRNEAMARAKNDAKKQAEATTKEQAKVEEGNKDGTQEDGKVIHTADDPNPNLADRRI